MSDIPGTIAHRDALLNSDAYRSPLMPEQPPVTDDDRRTAHEWAASLNPDMQCWTDRERAAARVILATVPAPPATLAGELRELNEGDIPLGALLELADRVEAVEKENRAALNHAYDERDEALVERDEARAEVTEWKRRTDHARAEVERLTAERLDRNPETKTRVESALSNLDQVEKVTVQKGAESNAETPDPADVKPGEAWKANIWYDGVHQPGTAIKSAGSSDWVVIRDDGSRSTFRMNEYVELVSRLVPGVTA